MKRYIKSNNDTRRLRADITNRVNELAETSNNLDLDVMGMYDVIFRAGKPFASERYTLKDDCLYIDGKMVGRFAPKAPKGSFDDKSYYAEGKILERDDVDASTITAATGNVANHIKYAVDMGYEEDSKEVYDDGEYTIDKTWCVNGNGNAVPNTLVYDVCYQGDMIGQFNTLGEAKKLIKEDRSRAITSATNPQADDYRLLDRLKSDCDYVLNNYTGGKLAEKHLWAGNAGAQIDKMYELYDGLKVKPEWITREDIDEYARRFDEILNQ